MTAESQWQEVKSSTVSFGKVGDNIEGTLTDIVVREVQDDKKGLVRKNVYEIKSDKGEYHETDENKKAIEPGIKCGAGDYFIVWGGRETIDGGMKKAKIGQKVKVVFTEQGEPKKKGYSGFKMIKVYIGTMDEKFLDEQKETALPNFND